MIFQTYLLFGSYARGEATPGSDIDLRIDKGRIRGLEFAGFLGDLQDAFDKAGTANIIYIRNEALEADYEVGLVNGSYRKDVLGLNEEGT